MLPNTNRIVKKNKIKSPQLHTQHWRQKLFSWKVLGIFEIALIVQLPFIYLIQLFVTKQDRAAWWRLVAHKNCLWLLKMWQVELDIKYRPKPDLPVIYACNHPSFADGLILFALLGPDIVALTAPFSSFPFPYNIWFKQMGFVDIQRDRDDQYNHQTANSKPVAFEKLLSYLEAGVSLFLFPEGHVERNQQLHYIHTGVARLSLRSNVAVQVMSLVGIEQIYPAHGVLQPGRISIRFAKRLEPPALSHYVPFRKAVKPFVHDIERQMVSILPIRYLPDYYGSNHQGVGVFIDIDHTLYDGYAQKDFVNFLLKKKVLPTSLPLRVIYWITLEKLHLVSHQRLVSLAYSVLAGLSTKRIDHLCVEFFQTVAVHRMNHKLLPIIKDHRAKGHVVVLSTEIFQGLARQFQRYVKAAASLDTVLEQHRGKYTGRIVQLNRGYAKASQIEQFAQLFGIDLTKSYAYADSASDLPMFYTCRHKIPVNPDKTLVRLAKKLGWQSS